MLEKGGLWYFDIFKNDFVQTKAASDIFILLLLSAWCDCSPMFLLPSPSYSVSTGSAALHSIDYFQLYFHLTLAKDHLYRQSFRDLHYPH